uniref:Cytochrome P450 n=1 Tax=Timema genevievae TaxID=629358 RepID=A0A7R9K912_TIMGE|nr:unnamed protein product [Timema genevievae]
MMGRLQLESRNSEGHPFGGFFKFRQPRIVLRDPELIKNVIVKDFIHFQYNDFQVAIHADPLFGKNPFCLKGEAWKVTRNQLTPGFTTGRIKAIYPHMREVCEELIEYMDQQSHVTPWARPVIPDVLSFFLPTRQGQILVYSDIAACEISASVPRQASPGNQEITILSWIIAFTDPSNSYVKENRLVWTMSWDVVDTSLAPCLFPPHLHRPRHPPSLLPGTAPQSMSSRPSVTSAPLYTAPKRTLPSDSEDRVTSFPCVDSSSESVDVEGLSSLPDLSLMRDESSQGSDDESEGFQTSGDNGGPGQGVPALTKGKKRRKPKGKNTSRASPQPGTSGSGPAPKAKGKIPPIILCDLEDY